MTRSHHATPRLVALTLAVAATACASAEGDDRADGTGTVASPAPALVELDLSTAGEAWKGLSILAPAGSVATDEELYLTVLGPRGSGWGIQITARDTFALVSKERRADPSFRTALVDEPDRLIVTRTSRTSETYSVLARTTVGDQVYTCKDRRLVTTRTLADSYVAACASLRQK